MHGKRQVDITPRHADKHGTRSATRLGGGGAVIFSGICGTDRREILGVVIRQGAAVSKPLAGISVDVGVQEQRCVFRELGQMDDLGLQLVTVALIHPDVWKNVFWRPVQQELYLPRILLSLCDHCAVKHHAVAVP